MTWHATPDLLVRYARTPEAVDASRAASIEAHLLSCAACRHAVAEAADPATVAESWRAIADVIDRPPEPLLLRALGRVGLPAESVRLVSATRQLVFAWLAAVLGSVAVAVWLARSVGAPGPFLVIAPVVPAAVVWLAFAPIADPAGEAGVAAPLSGVGLVLRRLVAIEVPAVLALALGAVAVPGPPETTLAWLLPSIALAIGCLALGTSIRITAAAGVSALAWLALVALGRAVDRHGELADTVLFDRPGQLAALAVVACGVAVCRRRRDRFATLEVTW
jgi:hypothetical protein